MTYFKINGHDYSQYVNKLQLGIIRNYKSRTTADGINRVQYKNTKHKIEVGFIMMDANVAKSILQDIESFEYDSRLMSHKIRISFLNPKTNTLVENLACFVGENVLDYYTIQDDNVKINPFSLTFTEI